MKKKKYPYYARGKVQLDENSEREDHRYGQERMKTQFVLTCDSKESLEQKKEKKTIVCNKAFRGGNRISFLWWNKENK